MSTMCALRYPMNAHEETINIYFLPGTITASKQTVVLKNDFKYIELSLATAFLITAYNFNK